MKNIPLKNAARKHAFLILSIGLLITSCKNDSSGGSNSWFSANETTLGSEVEIRNALDSAGDLELFKSDTVIAFYKNRDFVPVWNNDNLREELLQTLKSADVEGLYFEDYHGDKIQEKFKNLKSLSDQEKSNLDILLTDAFFKFGSHLYYGKLDPKKLHEIWDVQRQEIDLSAILNSAIVENDLEQALYPLRPRHTIYSGLIASANEYKELSKGFGGGWQDIASGKMIKHEEQDSRIPVIQERLKILGYLESIDITNTTNNKTIQQAIKDFQESNSLQSDGIIGDTTIELLNMDFHDRYEQILVNLERWRWYPRDLGEHYIIVNIANYDLHVVKGNDTVRTHRTMVGTEARKTPVFSEQVEYIVFNPTWTIPPTIQNDDVIPGVRKDPGYLSKKNINVLDKGGNVVNPKKINWGSDEAKSLTYMQNPGPSNPLGQVKIIYPNQYFIYLHDTPSQALFERNSRDQSSGCVRVEGAVDLAKYLLSDQDKYSSKEIDQIIEKGETTQIEMKQKVKVHHFYWTAWRAEGKTKFTADIYKYDSTTYEKLRKAS